MAGRRRKGGGDLDERVGNNIWMVLKWRCCFQLAFAYFVVVVERTTHESSIGFEIALSLKQKTPHTARIHISLSHFATISFQTVITTNQNTT